MSKKVRKSRGKDQRTQKLLAMKKVRGWNTLLHEWDNLALKEQEKLWDLSNKGSKLEGSMKEKARASDIYTERVQLYRAIAEDLGVRLTKGEALWAIQTEINFNKFVYDNDITEETYRNNLVHSLKYVIELVYGKYGYPDFDELKKRIYNRDIEGDLPETYIELEERYLEELHKFIDEVRVKLDRLT